MDKLQPTPEQQAIIAAAKSTQDNLLVQALAGAAKTSTLVMIAHALPSTAMLCLAFNKRIQQEMGERLPGNCNAFTLNSFGHRALAKQQGRNLRLDTKKVYTLTRAVIEELPRADKEEAYEYMSDIMKAVEWGKTVGWIPDRHYPNARPLCNDAEFFGQLDEEPSAVFERVVVAVTLESLAQGMKGAIDFNDQILLTTVFPCEFPQYPLVLVDEAQDLSALNHAMLRKFTRKRLIAVGDERQSIYGFRGAHTSSMQVLTEQFHMSEFTLSISFRCPIAVVKEAQWRAPHMKWGPAAAQGTVSRLDEWSVNEIPEQAAILCRNNAPLFAAAIALLKDGRYPELVGNDIGKNLLKTLKKLGPTSMTQDQTLLEIDKWETEKLKKARAVGKVKDQAACLRIFARQGQRLSDAIAYAEHILASSGPVKLMTVHKSKGLEFENVFLLDRELIQTGEDIQEQNLLYVAQTRAKSTLTYISSGGYVSKKHVHPAQREVSVSPLVELG